MKRSGFSAHPTNRNLFILAGRWCCGVPLVSTWKVGFCLQQVTLEVLFSWQFTLECEAMANPFRWVSHDLEMNQHLTVTS